MSAPPAFRRYLGSAFVSALHELVDRPEGQWWRDALTHSDLKFAIRNDALDVYYCGASIFRVAPQDGRVVARTHFKYLVRQRQGHASIAADGRTFIHDGAPLWPAYEGRVTLEEMLDAAKPLAGPEKTGLHPLILYPRVIDLEVAFRSIPDPRRLPLLPEYEDAVTGDGTRSEERLSEREGGPRHDRLDAVTLEERGSELWIVFHEAKHFANQELRAAPSRTPPVVGQIARYRRSIGHYKSDIAASYHEVCRALQELRTMRGEADPSGHAAATHWDELIARVADGDALHVDPEPRLIVFGFDDDQKRGSTWRHHRSRLEEAGLTVHAVGRPNKKAGATAFSRRAPASVEAGDAS